ncbi:MAG: hypothetical protein H7312_26010 [Tardiphaga sp.]|nr:hypothetical protein [Tardiphaga sp.]
MTDSTVNMDFQEQVARIERMQEETRKFTAEQHRLIAEQTKLGRDRALSGWPLVIAGMIAGAALVGATAALIKFWA